jgi:hypothetical protein
MRLQLLMLTSGVSGGAGIDLETGALRRLEWRTAAPVFAPYDVIEAQALPTDDLPFPNDMTAAIDPVFVGRMRGRRAEKLVKPLLHPGHAPLFGAATPSVTYWTLRSDAPSVSLVAPAAGPVVERDWPHHLRCRFRSGGLDHVLPVDDPRREERLSHPTATRLAGGTLARALGWKPDRLLVALTPPEEGRCHKVVAGLLPRA